MGRLIEVAVERLDNAIGSLPPFMQLLAFLALIATPALLAGVLVGALTHWALGLAAFCAVAVFSARWLAGRLDEYSETDGGG